MAGSPPSGYTQLNREQKAAQEIHPVPWKIYRGDPNWVPPLIFDQLRFFTPGKNPYFSHSTAQLFMAFRARSRSEESQPTRTISTFGHTERSWILRLLRNVSMTKRSPTRCSMLPRAG